jgi:hypothetical protein
MESDPSLSNESLQLERLENKYRALTYCAGSNTSTVALQVVGGDEKGSLKSETVKYGGTPTQERLRCQGPASYKRNRTVLSPERVPRKIKPVTVKEQYMYE